MFFRSDCSSEPLILPNQLLFHSTCSSEPLVHPAQLRIQAGFSEKSPIPHVSKRSLCNHAGRRAPFLISHTNTPRDVLRVSASGKRLLVGARQMLAVFSTNKKTGRQTVSPFYDIPLETCTETRCRFPLYAGLLARIDNSSGVFPNNVSDFLPCPIAYSGGSAQAFHLFPSSLDSSTYNKPYSKPVNYNTFTPYFQIELPPLQNLPAWVYSVFHLSETPLLQLKPPDYLPVWVYSVFHLSETPRNQKKKGVSMK